MIILIDRVARQTDFFAVCQKSGVTPIVAYEVAKEVTIFHGVQVEPQTLGIINEGIAEELAADNAILPNFKIIPFDDPAFSEEIYMFRKKGDYLTPAAMQLQKYVKQRVKNIDENKE